MTKEQDKLLEERTLKNSELDALKDMGFGLGALKALRNLVTEAVEMQLKMARALKANSEARNGL